MLLCVGSFFVYAFQTDGDSGQKGDDIAALVVLGIRYVAQGLRLVSLISRTQKQRERLDTQRDLELDKNDITEDDPLFDEPSRNRSRSQQLADVPDSP